MRHHHQTWTDPSEDEPISDHDTMESAKMALDDAREKHPRWSLWLAYGDDEDEANGDLEEMTECRSCGEIEVVDEHGLCAPCVDGVRLRCPEVRL